MLPIPISGSVSCRPGVVSRWLWGSVRRGWGSTGRPGGGQEGLKQDVRAWVRMGWDRGGTGGDWGRTGGPGAGQKGLGLDGKASGGGKDHEELSR